MNLSLYSLPSLGAALTLLFLFFYALRQRHHSPGKALLLSVIFHSLIYMVCEFLLINTNIKSWALLWDKIIYYAITITISNYLHLALVYSKPGTKIKVKRYLLALIYLPALFFVGMLPTDLFIAGMQQEYWGWGKLEGEFFNYFRYFLASYLWGAMFVIIARHRRADSGLKNGLIFLGLTYLGPIIATSIITMILQPLGINKFNIMIHPISIIYSAGFLFYAITCQHLLFDMQILLAPAIKTGKYRFHQRIKALIHKIHGNNLDYHQMVTMMQEVLKCAVGLNVNGQPVAACGGDAAFDRAKVEQLDHEVTRLHAQDALAHNELKLLSRTTFENFDLLYGHLEACGIEAILPLYDDGRILGTVKFGKGFSDKIYSKQDLQLITALWSQLVVALKYIHKLEEQLAVKDRIISKLNRKIQFLQTDFKSVVENREPEQESSVPAVLISSRQSMALPLENYTVYPNLQQALDEQKPAVVIVDGSKMSSKVRSALRTVHKPMVFIGRAEDMPKIENNRLVDHIPADLIENRLAPTVHFLNKLQQAVRFQVNGTDFVTICPNLVALLARVKQSAPKANTILLVGETGTGKELIAAYIAQACKQKIVGVNCAAISEGLFESAFFGHEKGAFTGADRCHHGYLEQAHNGILFLDEISELPMDLQAKLLRILEGGAFQRVGGQRFFQPSIQFVFASNRNLQELVKKGRFREDLLFRLDQLTFELPPLCERIEDIPLLAGYYLMCHKRQFGVDTDLNADIMAALKARKWPGNVRELSNAVLKLVIKAQDEQSGNLHEKAASLPEKVKSLEAALIQESLARCTSKTKAAEALGIPVSTFRSKLKNIDLLGAGSLVDDYPLDLEKDQNMADKISHYEVMLIHDSLKGATCQSDAARTLGVPLSTLRSKIKKHKIDVARPQ